MITPAGEPLKIVRLYDDLSGTAGDGGNAVVLVRRAERRGIRVEFVDVIGTDPVPDDGDIYLLGGGDHAPSGRIAERLGRSGALARAVDRGAAVLAVGAGQRVLGRRFDDGDATGVAGLGLLDTVSERAVDPPPPGEVVVDTDPSLGIGRLIGWRGTGHRLRSGVRVRPLGVVVADRPGPTVHEGVHTTGIVGTDLHGPVLALNPALADLVLARGVGCGPGDLGVIDDAPVDALRAQRLGDPEAASKTRRSWFRRRRG